MIDIEALTDWLLTRPAEIQSLAETFPIGDYKFNDTPCFLIGYQEYKNELPGVILTTVDPREDYDSAYEYRQIVCGDCLSKIELVESWLNKETSSGTR